MSRKRTYDWDKWFKREGEITLTRGVHYKTSQSNMAQQIRNWASHMGVSVSISDKGNSLVVQIVHCHYGAADVTAS